MLRIFDDNKSIIKNKVQKKTIPVQYIDQKRIVDINRLLNRVRMDKKILVEDPRNIQRLTS